MIKKRLKGAFSFMKPIYKNSLLWLLWIAIAGLLWQTAALAIDNALILPTLEQVLEQMKEQFLSPFFWPAVNATLIRTLFSLIVSILAALAAAFASHFFKAADFFLSRLAVMLQALPLISILILLLFWVSRQWVVFFVIFLLLFPIDYHLFLSRIKEIDKELHPLLTFYPNSRRTLITKVYWPLMKSDLHLALLDGLSLAFKSCIMAEIFGSLAYGIGARIQSSRFLLEVDGVIAWTAWLLIVCGLCRMMLSFILKCRWFN